MSAPQPVIAYLFTTFPKSTETFLQREIIARKLTFHVIDASTAAREVGLAGLTNTILQTCFFALSGVLPRNEAIEQIKASIRKT